MTDLELMRARLLTLFTRDARGRLLRVNEPNGARAPRFFLGRTAKGAEWRLRDDIDDALGEALSAQCRTEPLGTALNSLPASADRYAELLAGVERRWAGPVYRFPALLPTVASGALRVTAENSNLLAEDFPDWLADVPHRQPFFALVVGGRAVSVCCSVRIGALVHEAGIETHPLRRGHGYATQVTAAWAAAVWAWGANPVYSTSWENVSSLAVAKRLGLVQFGVDFHLT